MMDGGITGPPVVFIFSDFSVFPFFSYNKHVLLFFFNVEVFNQTAHSQKPFLHPP